MMEEKQTADFDLERFIEMFDGALTSTDERVINALRSLMMMVILTKPEGNKNSIGPLQQLFNDVHNLNKRLGQVEYNYKELRNHVEGQRHKDEYYKYKDYYDRTDDKYTLSQSDWDILSKKLGKSINSPTQLPTKGK